MHRLQGLHLRNGAASLGAVDQRPMQLIGDLSLQLLLGLGLPE
ncbi:MAG: hypothetical protein R6V43_04115 [Halopseudomonas sp.]